MKKVFALGFSLAAAAGYAALPDSVIEACLAPALCDRTSNIQWQVMTRAQWESAPTRIAETGGRTVAEQDGREQPNGWVRTTVSLSMAPLSEANPRPMQTLAIEATPSGVLPATTLDFIFVQAAKLPPYTLRVWQGRPALVADAGDWYIVADNPKTKVIRSEEASPATTLVLEAQRTEKRVPLRAAILVGEGPLPAEPEAPNRP